MDEYFKDSDLPLLNSMIRYFPDFLPIFGAIKYMNDQAQYPIASFEHLVEMLGGENQSLPFLQASYNVGHFRHAIPPYYFPISSQEDLIAKIARLRTEMTLPPPPRSAGRARVG